MVEYRLKHRDHVRPRSTHHFFHDVADLVKLDGDLSKKSFPEKKAAVEKANIAKSAPCKIHRKKCKVPWTHMDISGSFARITPAKAPVRASKDNMR